MPSKYTRKRKHDLDKDTTEFADGNADRDSSPAKKTSRKPAKKKDDAESMSIEETNKLRAELGLAPLEVEEPSDEQAENVVRDDGGVLFKEDGVEIVHKAAKNLTEDKESSKVREKLELQKEKHRIYGKVLKAQKGLGESDSEDEGGVDNFLERMRAQAEKKAQAFDSLDQEAEQEAALAAKKAQQRKAREARKKQNDALTANLLVGHSKEDFADGTETILVLQDKGVLDDDTEELLVNPNMVDDERHKRNVEKRKQKSDYSAYDEDTIDEFGMSKKKNILDKYDNLDNEEQRETFRLDAAGGYDLDREEQALETKRRLAMANKKFESLETPKYIPAREFYTEEEMLTFRKPKKKKDKLRKTRTLKAADLETVQEETSAAEKEEKAKRLAARRRDRGEAMEVDEEASKNGSKHEDKFKKPVSSKDMEEGEVVETEQVNEVGAPQVSKWKQATGASVDLSRIRSFAAKVDAKEDDEESDEEEDLVQGVNLTGVVIDDDAEEEFYGALAQSRKLKQIKVESNGEDRAKYVRQMLSSHGVIKEEPGESDGEEEESKPLAFADGIIIDATSEQYKLIGDIPTFGLAGNRNDDVDYSELLAEHRRIAEQQMQEQTNKEQRKHSDDDEDLSDVETEIKTNKLKRRRSKDSDMEVDSDEEDKKPVWKAIGDDEPTSSKHDSKRNYRKNTRSSRNDESDDDEVYGDDYKNVLGEERDVTKGVGAMLRLAAEKGYLDNSNRGNSSGALKHLESKRFSRVDQGRMDIEDKYIRKLERMGTTGSGPIRSFAEKSDYKPNVEISYTDKQGRPIEEKEAFRELSHKFHGKGSGKKKIEKRQAQLKKQDRMKQMNSSDTPLGTLQKQLKKQEQLQSAFIILSGSNRSDLGSQLQKE